MGRKQRRSRRREARSTRAVARRAPKRPLLRRLTQHIRDIGTTIALIVREPRQAPGLLRYALIGLWGSRGGGFYGLGFVVTFVVLEVQTVMQQFATSASFVSFITEQLLEFAFRLAWTSLLNTFLALLWPVFVLDKLGGWGIIALGVGFLGYERLLRPLVAQLLPELRPIRNASIDGALMKVSSAAPVLAANASLPEGNANNEGQV